MLCKNGPRIKMLPTKVYWALNRMDFSFMFQKPMNCLITNKAMSTSVVFQGKMNPVLLEFFCFKHTFVTSKLSQLVIIFLD